MSKAIRPKHAQGKQLEGFVAYLYAQSFTPYLQEKGSMSARGEAPRDHVKWVARDLQHMHGSNVLQGTVLDLAQMWIVQSAAAKDAAVSSETTEQVLIPLLPALDAFTGVCRRP